MANRFPLIVDSSGVAALKELPSGDNLDLTGSGISGGDYTNLQPEQTTASVSSTHNIDMDKPLHIITMTGSTTFSFTNIAEGKITMIKMNVPSGNTPSFGSTTKWPAATEPTWSGHAYWLISVIGHSSSVTLASATGYTV